MDQTLYGYSYDALYELVADEAHTYDYDANLCRIAKDQETAPVNALFELFSLPCDPNGNPVRWDEGCCTFDALDRLTAIEWPDRRVEYAYDAAHRRLSKRLFSKTSSSWQETQRQYFLYDGANEIGSVDEHGKISELRILGRTPQAELGAAVALELHGEVYLPLHDLVGSVRGVVPVKDPSKKVIYEQTPFGEEAEAAYISPWRFSAKRVDAETSLVYYGRRYYAPPLGRWLTTDPAGFTDSLNLYAFVKNNPLLYRDLYGLYTSDNASSLNYDPGPSERVSGASLVAKAFESSSDFVWEVLTSPYLHGSMQVLGGFSEAAIGSSVAMLSPPLGIAMIVHGADQCTAGLRTIYYGAHARTATSQLLELTGLAPGTADLMDSGLSLGGAAWGGAYLLYCERMAMQAAFRVPESAMAYFEGIEGGQNFKSFIKGNCRDNLMELTGVYPPGNIHAHHVFAQKFRKEFLLKGINIDDPRYLTWWGEGHLSNASTYNRVWGNFIRFENPEATSAEILQKGRELMSKHGIEVNY